MPPRGSSAPPSPAPARSWGGSGRPGGGAGAERAADRDRERERIHEARRQRDGGHRRGAREPQDHGTLPTSVHTIQSMCGANHGTRVWRALSGGRRENSADGRISCRFAARYTGPRMASAAIYTASVLLSGLVLLTSPHPEPAFPETQW